MNLPEQIQQNKKIISAELNKRLPWLIRMRWWVPPSIVVGVICAKAIGVEFSALPILAAAFFILAYNVVFHFAYKRFSAGGDGFVRGFAFLQAGLDLASVFLIVYYTGGVCSPFIFFFIFHIIFASMLLNPSHAWAFAAFVSAGMSALSLAEAYGLIGNRYQIFFRGQPFSQPGSLLHILVILAFFSASIFITAYLTTAIMEMLRRRIIKLAELSEDVVNLNNRLGSLYAMTKSIVSTKDIDSVLSIVTSELASVMGVGGITVKLLTEDGSHLRYAAVHGDFLEGLRGRTVDIAKSPLNRRVIEGESFVAGSLTEKDAFQYGEDLAVAQVQSVQLVPLKAEDRIVGVLGAYSRRARMFRPEDADFFRLAADLAAIALENARAYKAIEDLMTERSWFMAKVTHNLRAPIAAMISILDVVRGNYVGELNPKQAEYLQRIDRRARGAIRMVTELMTLAKSRSGERKAAFAPVDLGLVADHIRQTYQEDAHRKKQTLTVAAEDGLPKVLGDAEMIEQMMENLVSNAIKYTPVGGEVGVSFRKEDGGFLFIEVRDTGIGIPENEKQMLFTEYFRGKNARATEEIGTGLGLPIIKETVVQHGGRISVESREGEGTRFLIHLPAAAL